MVIHYQTPLEDRMSEYIHSRVEKILLDDFGDFLDPEKCPERLLPVLALFRRADMYTNLFGVDFQRKTIKSSGFIKQGRWRHPSLALHSEDLDALYVLDISRASNGDATECFLTIMYSSEFAPNTPERYQYYLESYQALLPIPISRIDFVDHAYGIDLIPVFGFESWAISALHGDEDND